MKKERINCFNCAHLYITWDRKFPKGCRAMNFKSKQMPSTVVYKSSGTKCLKFKPKKNKPAIRGG
ncbi:MAG TPA: uracil-DNA glycosylase [Nitrospirae bacterium]|nr:uracil-DNA glycosylase [Nitrospirota bacterium]